MYALHMALDNLGVGTAKNEDFLNSRSGQKLDSVVQQWYVCNRDEALHSEARKPEEGSREERTK
jgi:hypothetical protein